MRSRVPQKPLTNYTFTYQLDGEDSVRQETFIWHLGFRAAFSLGSRIIHRRHPYRVKWIEL